MSIEYLNNSAFELLITRFKVTSKKRNKKEFEAARQDLADAFTLLTENIIKAFKFQLVDQDDALQEGVMTRFDKLHRFDPEKGKLFNFATTIILNHFRQLYRTAKNYNDFKIKYFEHIKSKDPPKPKRKSKGKKKERT